MSKCTMLQRKNQKVEPDCLIAPNSVGQTESLEDGQGKGGSSPMGVAESGLSPFVSKAFVRLKGNREALPINVLKDTGATQSLILDSVLPFSDKSSTGISVLLQGVEMGVIQVPLHFVQTLSLAQLQWGFGLLCL